MVDDDYEYEYDPNETETFLVQLDLSTLNGINRPPKSTRNNRKRKKAHAQAGIDADDNEQSSDGGDDEAEANEFVTENGQVSKKRSKKALQVLDIDTLNPLVAYKGDFYSCEWHDMVGTDMFFSLPHQDLDHPPVLATKDFQLLGTSRVRLRGQRAKVYEKPGARKKQQADGMAQDSVRQTEIINDAGALSKEQSDFWQKLVELQQGRDERDAAG